MKTSPDFSQSIRTLTLDDFERPYNRSQRMQNTFKGKTLPLNQGPPSKQQIRSQLKWNRLYAKSNFGIAVKRHILSPQSALALESVKPSTVSQASRQHLQNSIVSISQCSSHNFSTSAQKSTRCQNQTPQSTAVKEEQVEDTIQMQIAEIPEIKQYDSFTKPFVTQFAAQLGLKHGRTSDEDYKLSSYTTRNVVIPAKRKATTLKQFLEQQSNILDDMKNEQELAYQNKQREQQLTRLVTQWEEINGRKLQSRLDDMGFPKRIDFEKINALKMRATAIKNKPGGKVRFL